MHVRRSVQYVIHANGCGIPRAKFGGRVASVDVPLIVYPIHPSATRMQRLMDADAQFPGRKKLARRLPGRHARKVCKRKPCPPMENLDCGDCKVAKTRRDKCGCP